ncbi:MAG TPA: hypothetical protein VH281_01980 [Gaiellaceae bacterium]|jgi:hypothetical protein
MSGRASLAALLSCYGLIAMATCYEALLAIGVIDLGSQPGEGPAGEGAVLAVVILALLIGLVFLLLAPRGSATAFVPLAAALFLVARFHTFDPYYLPTLRRMSDQGLVSPALVYALVALGICSALLARGHPSAVRALAVPVVLGSAFLALVAGAGH